MTAGIPKEKAPPGTWDTHMHIYDQRYPRAATAKIVHGDALVPEYEQVRKRLGIEHTVVVQPSAYGTDNRCTLEAMAALGPGTRGVAVVDETVTDAELDRLTKLGTLPMDMSPPQFNDFVRKELDDTAKVMKAAGIKPQ